MKRTTPSLSSSFARLALTAGLLLALAAPARATDFRSTDVQPDGYPTVEAVKFMGAQLAKATGGKLNIKVFSSGALGSEKDTIEQAKIGAVAMARVNISPMRINASGMIPPAPTPCRARAKINEVMLFARPHQTEPIRNSAMAEA